MKRILNKARTISKRSLLIFLSAMVVITAIPLTVFAAFRFAGTAGFQIIDDTDSRVNFMGEAWKTVTDSNSHDGSSRVNTDDAGRTNETSAVILTFTGTALKVNGRTAAGLGAATYTVYNDAGQNNWDYLAIVPDVSSDGDGEYASELISFTGLENKEHKLRIVTNGKIDIDFFEVSTAAAHTNVKATELIIPDVTMKQFDYEMIDCFVKDNAGSYIGRRPTLSSNDVDAISTYQSSPSTTRLKGDLGIMAMEWGRSSITAIIDGIEKNVKVNVQKIEKEDTLRRKIDKDNFLYLENYYWGDDLSGSTVLDLWETVPESLRAHTVILLIAERSIADEEFMLGYGEKKGNEYHQSKDWIEYNVSLCNDNNIPVAIQAINGETGMRSVPVDWFDALAKKYPNIQGLNGAEMYNGGFGWGNDFKNYMTQLTRVCVENGLHLMWTDTALGTIDGWFQSYAPLERVFRENKENIVMMNKQSFSDSGSEALYKGMWLSDYCDNWGVASDWWNWQIDGLNLHYEGIGLGALAQCFAIPEVRYSQDIMRTLSQGATAFKSEAQWFSNAAQGMRTPAYQRVILPMLEKVASGGISIPSKEEVISRTKSLAVGKGNWVNTYSGSVTNVHPVNSEFGIVPYTLTTVPRETLDKLENAGIKIYDSKNKMTVEKLVQDYKDVNYVLEPQGTVGGELKDGYLETYGDGTWYWQNTYDKKFVVQSTKFSPVINEAESIKISAGSHSLAIINESSDRINVYLNNYRYFKDDLKAMDPPDDTPCNEAYYYSHRLAQSLRDGTIPEQDRYQTTLEVKTSAKPHLVFSPVREFQNPYDAQLKVETNIVWNPASSTATITILHNGPVEFDIVTDGADDLASSISLNKTNVTVERFENEVLKATLNNGAKDKFVSWSSSDNDVASVSAYGVVTGNSAGLATITATTANGTIATCNVTVPDPMVKYESKEDGDIVVKLNGASINSGSTVKTGDHVEITPTPNMGYIAGLISINNKDYTNELRSNGSITIVATNDLKIDAVFVPAEIGIDEKTALKTAVSIGDKIEEGHYTSDSFGVLSAKLVEAKAIIDKPTASQSEIKNAVGNILFAISGLDKRIYYTEDDSFIMPSEKDEIKNLEAEHLLMDVVKNRRYAKLVYHDSSDGWGRHTITASNGIYVGDFGTNNINKDNKLTIKYNAAKAGTYSFVAYYRGAGTYSWSGSKVTSGSKVMNPTGYDSWTKGVFYVEITSAGEGEIVLTAPAGGMPITDRFEVVMGKVDEPDEPTGIWIMVGDESPSVKYTGDTFVNIDSGSSGGRDTFIASGGRASYTFTGTGIRYYSQLDPGGGTADIYMDGVKVLENLTYKSTGPAQTQVLRYENASLDYGEHTIEIVRTSSGAMNNNFVSIDHFEYINAS